MKTKILSNPNVPKRVRAKAANAVKKVMAKYENRYNVNQKLWGRFKTNEAKKIFNDVMEQSLKNQEVTSHPKMPVMTNEQWNTICWNFACYAAWSVRDEKLQKGTVVIDIKDGKETQRRIAK